jgi:hypothetical protein
MSNNYNSNNKVKVHFKNNSSNKTKNHYKENHLIVIQMMKLTIKTSLIKLIKNKISKLTKDYLILVILVNKCNNLTPLIVNQFLYSK